MPDAWDRERPQPVAVGPPRRRMSRADRIREARRRRRRRMVRTVTLSVFIVIVIGAVFLGSRLWHTVFGAGYDYSGDGESDVVIQVHDGDSTTAIGQTLEDHKVVATSRAFVSAAEGNAAHSVDPAGLLQDAHRDTSGECRCATDRCAEPGGQARHSGRPSARRHPRRQDQRRHRRHLHVDLQRHLRGPRR